MANKKQYCVCIINQDTGEVEHMMVNDNPIPREMYTVVEDNPDAPPGPPIIRRYRKFEFEAPRSVRARDVLDNIKVQGSNKAERQQPNAGIDLDTLNLPDVVNFEDKGND